ncbi:hypothetical protein [Thalassospira xiamenensis]|uniref:Uncharacterized protein n=1 Tax=Thalassospira xiamenensis TaxID=220697 RepID=A0A285TUQ0_9PROT|nr:hypothetical protein [Thalassospira xiamenensis]SOC27209.1 hypothetical protein SAMN05428964_105306 [Thalassospira xiamenensis]
MKKILAFSIVFLGVAFGLHAEEEDDFVDDDLPMDNELPADAVTVFDRYEQRLDCGLHKVSFHSLVALKPKVPSDQARDVSGFIIRDPSTRYHVTAGVQGQNYVFKDLFHKPRHEEQWRAWCYDGECQANLNYYLNEFDADDGTRDITVEVLKRDGTPFLTEPQTITINAVSGKQAARHRFGRLDGYISDNTLISTFTPATSLENPPKAVVQTVDSAGHHEEQSFELSSTGTSSLTAPVPQDATYVAVYVYTNDQAISDEVKLELVNRSVGPGC